MSKMCVKLQARDVEVLIALVNPDNPKFRRTQSDVCELLGYEPYAVSRSVKRLVEGKYIRKKEHHRKGAIYVPHTHYNIAISQVNDEFRAAYAAKAQLVADRVAVTYPATTEVLQEPFTLQPHVSGSMPYFRVIEEGKTQFKQEPSLFSSATPKDPISELKMKKRIRSLNGSEDWDGLFVLDYGRSFRLRYQRTKKYRYFYVSPMYDIESLSDELLHEKDAPFGRVIIECYPMLSWLSKYAGWKFMTDADGNYIPQNKTAPKDVHIQVNHMPTTDFLSEHVGPFTSDGLVADASGGVLRYEVRANHLDYVVALVDGPVTRELAFKHEREITGIIERVGSVNNGLNELKESFNREICALWVGLEKTAKTQNATEGPISYSTQPCGNNEDEVKYR